jgi:hypothetical protein
MPESRSGQSGLHLILYNKILVPGTSPRHLLLNTMLDNNCLADVPGTRNGE